MDRVQNGRSLLKSGRWREWGAEGHETDQRKGVPAPPIEKPYPADAARIDLVPADKLSVGRMRVIEVIRARKSRRHYTDAALTLEEISFLLWATQGLREPGSGRTFRTVPSGGNRHEFETYLLVQRVDGVPPGMYRYLPVEHQLCFLFGGDDLPARLAEACAGQAFVAGSAVTLIWTAIPYRMEWRYDIVAHKVIAIDAGHVCQNLYLACESIGAGTCAVGAYYQDEMDALVQVDGSDEFVVYLAPVGKVD